MHHESIVVVYQYFRDDECQLRLFDDIEKANCFVAKFYEEAYHWAQIYEKKNEIKMHK